MKCLVYFILFYLHFSHCKKYLTKQQVRQIKTIIQHPASTNEMKTQVHKILFYYYNEWACNKAYYFKRSHPYKCMHISVNELSGYASIGLIKSIKNYNGINDFTKYATFYVEGELYNGITDLHPISIISKKNRKKKQTNTNNSTITFIGNAEWLLNKYILEQYEENEIKFHDKFIYNEFWSKIYQLNQIEPITKMILHYKFFNDFEKRRSNRDISHLVHMSEESIRQKLRTITATKSILTL